MTAIQHANNDRTYRFSAIFGDAMGTKKYIDYKPAELKTSDPKKWFVAYSYRDPETGKFHRFKVYEGINEIKDPDDRLSFGKELTKAVNKVLDRGFNPFREPEKLFVRTWTLLQGLKEFERKLPERNLRPQSEKLYKTFSGILTDIFRPIHLKDLDELRRKDLEPLLSKARAEKKWSGVTYNMAVKILRLVFSFLIESELTTSNPAKSIKRVHEDIKRNLHFDDKSWQKIKDNADPELLRFIMFLYHTGARPNEAAQMTGKNINREKKLLLFPSAISKNKKNDSIPLTDYVLKNYGEGKLFKWSASTYGKKFSALKKKLGLDPDHTLYAVRHTRATHLAEDKADPYTIMGFLRHSSLVVTMRYIRGLSVNREAADKVR